MFYSVSAFYFECPEKQMSLNASIWTKSKFMGMSIGVVMVGKCKLLFEIGFHFPLGRPAIVSSGFLQIAFTRPRNLLTSCHIYGHWPIEVSQIFYFTTNTFKDKHVPHPVIISQKLVILLEVVEYDCDFLILLTVVLKLLEYDEEYSFSLPSAYARSILTVPWVELGDRVTVTCPKTQYSASVVFHTKVSDKYYYVSLSACIHTS